MRQTKTNFMVSMIFILLAIVSIHANAASPQPVKAPSRAVVDPDNISPVVLLEGSLPVTWTNDDTYPWLVDDGYIHNGSNVGKKNTSAWISFSFNSNYQTEVKFDWYCYNYSNHALYVYIDGVYTGYTTTSFMTQRYYLQKGQHIISFKDSIGNSTSTSNYSRIRNVKVTEIKDLSDVVLGEGSMPLTFTNDPNWPWMPHSDGERIYNTNYGVVNSTGKISTTFSIDKVSVFSYYREVETYNNNSSNYYHYLKTSIDGITTSTNYTSGGTYTRVLKPGTHTITWTDSVTKSGNYLSYLKNIKVIDAQWIDIEVTPGQLGRQALYYEHDVWGDPDPTLGKVEFLKVRGTLNESDWNTIKDMNNLRGLDLSEASITNIPNNAFSKNTVLQYCVLPDVLKSIGESAFISTSLQYLNIPSNVISIGNNAFKNVTGLTEVEIVKNSKLETIGVSAFEGCTRLYTVKFDEGCQQLAIGDRAFFGCTNLRTVSINSSCNIETVGSESFRGCSVLTEFIMPNSITSCGASAFRECSKLKKIVFSDAIETINSYTCYQTYSLADIHLPSNLKTIGQYAFAGFDSYFNYGYESYYTKYRNDNLKSIEFPNTLNSIGQYAFAYCNLDSVKLPIKLESLGQYAFFWNQDLKYVDLPSYISSYNYQFSYCTAIKKVICHSATPPSIAYDPFQYLSKGNATLVVPSFAVIEYKLDSYWKNFGSIVEGEDVDYWKITSLLDLSNNRRMQGKPDIDLYSSGQLVVGGNAPMPIGRMNYYAGGRLLNNCPSMTIDELTTFYSVSANTWYFFTPIYDIDLTQVKHSNSNASFVFRFYNAAQRAANSSSSGNWQNVTTGKLEAGKGYIFITNTAGTLTIPASAAGIEKFVNTEDVTVQLETHECSNKSHKNWNYLGNPYPCYYDIYYMDFTAPIQVYNGSTYLAKSIADDGFSLSPMRSFFVQKPDELDKLVFHKDGRLVSSTTPNHANAPRRGRALNPERKLYDFALISDSVVDETRVVINPQASLDYELSCDASKFMSPNTEIPQLYTVDQEGTLMAINERPLGDSTVVLGLYVGAVGRYTIDASRCPGEVILIDRYMAIETDLNNGSYSFDVNQVGYINDRFLLKFMNESSNVKEILANNNVEVYPTYGGVEIKSSAKAWANVYTIDGRLMYNVLCANPTTFVTLPNGIYMVQINNHGYKVIVK